MLRKIEIGSQIFIDKTHTPNDIRHYVSLLKESGMTIIRLFMVWDQIEPRPEKWNFDCYDACFDEAEKQGLFIVPTLMAGSPPGYMHKTNGIQDVADCNDLDFWKTALNYVKKIVERYGNSSALHSWILWNEPNRDLIVNDNSLREYRKWLKNHYKDIRNLNLNYFRQYDSFDDVYITSDEVGEVSFKGYCETIDWIHFSVDNLMEKLRDIKNQIREIDSHPVHLNPHNLGNNHLRQGQSIWKEGEIADFMGCSVHPSWHSVRFPRDRYHQSVSFFADLAKSATAHEQGKFWVTELQGGTNIYSGFDYLCPGYNDIKLWMWQSIGSGADGVVFWCLNTRTHGFEGGEWGLLNQLDEPSARLQAVSDFAGVLEQHRSLFENSVSIKPNCWILYSENSIILSDLEGTGTEKDHIRNNRMACDAICGAYLMLSDLGYNIGFIDEKGLENGKLACGDILVLPAVTSLPQKSAEMLAKLAESGVIMIADGLCGFKDEYGYISKFNQKAMDRVFGSSLIDVHAQRDAINLNEDEYEIPSAFYVCDFSSTSEKHIQCKLGCYWIGTVFFQQYMQQPNPSLLRYLKHILPEPQSAIVTLLNTELQIKILAGDGYFLLIIINANREPAVANIQFATQYQVELLYSKLNSHVTGIFDHIDIQVDTMDVAVVKIS